MERYPEYEHSGYTKQVVWVDQEHYRPQKLEYFDRKGSKLKTLVFKGYKQYLDKYWRADQMDMVNHQNGKSTTLIWSDYKFRNGYSDRDFDRNTLKRIR